MAWTAPGASRLSLLAKILIVTAAIGVGLWVALGVTLTLVIGQSQPAVALALWPHGASSNAALAEALVQTSARQRARSAAQKALHREPVNVAAVRSLGLLSAMEGDGGRARRLFAYSETLSRRDAPTQLWLIEESVVGNDIEGALRHYDRALRTSVASRDVLIPVLARAAGEPGIAGPLSRLVASRPLWWPALLEQMIAADSTSPEALALMMTRLRLSPRGDYRWLLSRALSRLADEGAFEQAYAIYREARAESAASAPLLRDGDFSTEYPIPPFDWMLKDQPELAGVKVVRPGAPGGSALSIVADSGQAGEVARQLLLLRPGQYQLAAVVGGVPSDEQARPTVSVMCFGGSELARTRFTDARLRLLFVVPQSGCRGQWIRIEAGPGIGQADESRPWITSVSLTAL